MLYNPINVIGYFWNEDDVRSTRYACCECNMARITTHYLKNHDPVMAGSCWLQSIQGFSRNSYSCIKSNRGFGHGKVIINCLGNSDEWKITLDREPVEYIKATIATNTDKCITVQLPKAVDNFL